MCRCSRPRRPRPAGRFARNNSLGSRILGPLPNVFTRQPGGRGASSPRARRATGGLMKRTLVRYKAKPDAAQENQRLIEQVFEELRTKAPQGVRYLALKLPDGS